MGKLLGDDNDGKDEENTSRRIKLQREENEKQQKKTTAKFAPATNRNGNNKTSRRNRER